MPLYDNIRAQCRARGMSVTRLEEICGFGAGTISKWTRANPTVQNLKKVADYFHLTMDDLLREEDDDASGEG